MWPLIIPNIYEFNRRHFDGARASPSELFSQAGFIPAALPTTEPTVAIHEVPNADLRSHWTDRLGLSPHFVEVPPTTGKLCRDILTKPGLIDEIRGMGKPVFWGITADTDELLLALGYDANTPGLTALVDLLNGKAGNKALVDHLTTRLAPAWGRCPAMVIPATHQELESGLSGALGAWGPLIVKPGMTWGGKGTRAIYNSASIAAAVQELALTGSAVTGSYFLAEPLLGDPGTNLSPSIDWNPISKRPVVGRMIMSGYSCTGTAFGLGALETAGNHRLEFAAFCEGTASYLSDAGYYGWFDVDVLDTGASLYVSEFNVRHTGGTVPIRLAEFLLGEEWESNFAVTSIDGLKTDLTFGELERRLQSSGFGVDRSSSYVITNYERRDTKSRFSVWLCSPDPDAARDLRERLLATQ